MPEAKPTAGGGIAFLLTQLGTHAAGEFAAALAEHDLTPRTRGSCGCSAANRG